MDEGCVAAQFRFFARSAASLGSALYARLAAAASEDAATLALAARARPGQPPANLLFAAVHAQLLRGETHALGAYYATCGGGRAPDAGAWTAFRAFLDAHADEIAGRVETGVTNTNETLRSAALAPAFAEIAARTGLPLALIELGPSAGLNLRFDRYRFVYRDAQGEPLLDRWGPSPVVVETVSDGPPPPMPDTPAAVVSRVGLERDPVDLSDPEARLRLRALVWPDRPDRLARLDAAIALAAAPPFPDIRKGDAAALLPAALGEAPEEAALVVFHSAFLYQLTDDMRAAIEAAIVEAARRRPVWRVAFDWAGVEGTTPVVLSRYGEGAVSSRVLADSDDHALRVRWRA